MSVDINEVQLQSQKETEDFLLKIYCRENDGKKLILMQFYLKVE